MHLKLNTPSNIEQHKVLLPEHNWILMKYLANSQLARPNVHHIRQEFIIRTEKSDMMVEFQNHLGVKETLCP